MSIFEKVDLKAELAKAEAAGAAAPKEESAATPPAQESKPAPAATKEPSAPAEDSGGEPEGGDATDPAEPRRIPLKILHEERERHKRELEARAKREALLEDRLQKLQEAVEKEKQPPAPPPPKFEDDPAAYLRYVQEQTGKSVDELRGHIIEKERAQEHAEKARQVQAFLEADEQSFIQEAPDFRKATDFLAQHRDKELLEDWGITDPAQRQALVKQDFLAHTQACLQHGQSSARRLYALAQQRGYKAETQAATATAGAEEKIAMLEKGQRAARSLSNAGGKVPGTLTLESLASMSDEEFKSASAGKNWAKLFGKA